MDRFRGIYQVEKYKDKFTIHYVIPIRPGHHKEFHLVNPTRAQLIRFMQGFDLRPITPLDGKELSLYFLKKMGYAS